MITIKAEVRPGSTILEAFTECIKFANKLECIVEFKFNGVVCIAYQNGNAEKGAESFFKNCTSDVKIAWS